MQSELSKIKQRKNNDALSDTSKASKKKKAAKNDETGSAAAGKDF